MRLPIARSRLVALALGAVAATLGLRLAAGEAAERLYECRQGGGVIFSDTPCTDPGGDPVVDPGPGIQRTVEVDFDRPDAAQAQQAAAAQESQAGTLAEAALLDTQILNLQERIMNLQAEGDAQVAALRNQLAQGTEQTDTASWAAGLNQQIQSVSTSYSDQILVQRTRLSELQARRASLGRSGPPQ